MNTLRKHLIAAICALAASLPCIARSAPMSTSKEIVWHWFSQCSAAKVMAVEVSLDRRIVYKSSFSICQMRLGDILPDRPQRLLAFFLKAENRRVFGERRAERINVNIWEAGQDPNDIILGISFTTKQRIWLNSLHIADPGKPSRTALAKGLTITTYPAQSVMAERQNKTL